MIKLIMIAIGVVFSLSIMNEPVWAGFGGGSWGWGSIHCDRLLNGLSRKAGESNDLNVSCTINIKEIFAACVNKNGNADPANGQPFQVEEASITGLDIGSGFKITGKGTTVSEVEFTDDQIAAALGENLPEIACPNGNWQLRFAVSRFDGVVELLTGAVAQLIPGVCAVTEVSLDPATACTPGPLATCHQEECIYFHDNSDGLLVQGEPDNTECAKPTLDFNAEDYDCDCDYQVIRKDTGDQVSQPCKDKINCPIGETC